VLSTCHWGSSVEPAAPYLGVVAAVDEDVLRLEVAVHDACGGEHRTECGSGESGREGQRWGSAESEVARVR
jgi:hypothetical protein